MTSIFQELIIRSVRCLSETDGIDELREANLYTVLFGRNGALDSAELIFLITEIDEAVGSELGIDTVLVDEKAFAGRSPFRTVASLASYPEECVAEAKCAENLW